MREGYYEFRLSHYDLNLQHVRMRKQIHQHVFEITAGDERVLTQIFVDHRQRFRYQKHLQEEQTCPHAYHWPYF